MMNISRDSGGNWENTTQGIEISHAISNDFVGKSGSLAVEGASIFFPTNPIVSAITTTSKIVSPMRPGGTSAAAIGKQAISVRKTKLHGSLRVTRTVFPLAIRAKTATLLIAP